MRFSSRGTEGSGGGGASPQFIPISHLQQGSGPRLSARRAQASCSRRIHLSAVDFCAPGRVRARAPAVLWLVHTHRCAPGSSKWTRSYEGTHEQPSVLKKKKIRSIRERKKAKHLFLFGRVFSNSTGIIMNQKRVPPGLWWKWKRMAELEGP